MTAPATAATLHWTTDAVEAIRAMRDGESRPDSAFRVDVRLGGCQGFKLYFELDEPNDDDVVLAAAPDVAILVQADGMPFIAGGVLDYEDSHRGSGFRIANPQAGPACGCGQAFYVDGDALLAEEAQAGVVE
jgi:iron-sulfur cluster assembly accessory protein